MKKLLRTGFMMLTVSLLFTACQPDELKEIGESRNVLSSLQGTWKLIKATQVDEDAATRGFPYKELDITNLFPYTNFQLKLDLANGAPSTFSTTPGSSPKIIKLASGNWSVDNANYPKVVTLTSGVITEKVTLGGYPVGPNNTLKLKVERNQLIPATATSPEKLKLLISYSYEFAKQ